MYIDHEKLIDKDKKSSKASFETWAANNEDLIYKSHDTTYQHNKSLENKMRNKNFDFKFGDEQKEDMVKYINKKFDSQQLLDLKNKTKLNHKDKESTQNILDQLKEYFTKTSNFNECASQYCTQCIEQNYSSVPFKEKVYKE